MASITVLSCIALLAGLGLSAAIGARANPSSPVGCVGSAFTAIVLGIALAFAAGITHAVCEDALHFCAPTTDTTVWSVSYPLMAVPVYWIVMLATSRTKQPGQVDGHFLRHEPADPGTLPNRIASARAELDEASRRNDTKGIIDAAGNVVALLTAARREGEAVPIGLGYLPLARSNPTLEESAWLLHQLATAAQYHSLRAQANDLFAEALQSCRRHGWRRLEHFVLHHWGRSQVEEGNLEGAERCFRESRAIRAQLGEPLVSSDRALSELAKLQGPGKQG